MKICYNGHRLITRSNRLVSGQQKSKETQTNPPNNQPKPTKSDQSVKVRHTYLFRTEKHGQSIYGPSVTPLESTGRDGVHHVSLVALGGSKAMREFLVLHYMATNSAEEWDTFLHSLMKVGTPGVWSNTSALFG